MIQGLKKKAESLGLPFGDRKKTFNSRLAQELGLWAESEGQGDRFHDLAFRAYFQHGRNIAQVPVLLDLVDTAGLPVEEAERVLSERTFSEAVDADWQLSRELEIRAVPTFLYGFQRLVGAQPYETLRQLVKNN